MKGFIKMALLASLPLVVFGCFLACSSFSIVAKQPVKGKAVARANSNAVSVPIIMYHAVIPDGARINKYAINKKQMAQDLDYLVDKGYNTIDIGDVVDYVDDKKPLPKNPIILTFDDGFYSMLTTVAPMLKQRGQKAVCAVVGEFCRKAIKEGSGSNYSYLNFAQTAQLKETGVFEIQSHTDNLHWQSSRLGANIKPHEAVADYKKMLIDDLNALNARFKQENINATALVYPYGLYNKHSEEVAKQLGFKATLSCNEGINYISKNPQCLYLLKRYNRSGIGKNIQELLSDYVAVY